MNVSLNTQESIVKQVISEFSHCDTLICCSLSPIDLNPCAHLSPCENGGTCSKQDPNQYSCACLPGFTGMDCGQEINECNVSPCANGATCIVSDDKKFTKY